MSKELKYISIPQPYETQGVEESITDRFTQLLIELESVLFDIKELSQSYIITNLNNKTFEENTYYLLWYDNDTLSLKKITTAFKNTYIFNLNTATLTLNGALEKHHALNPFLQQVESIANDLLNDRAQLICKEELIKYE